MQNYSNVLFLWVAETHILLLETLLLDVDGENTVWKLISSQIYQHQFNNLKNKQTTLKVVHKVLLKTDFG